MFPQDHPQLTVLLKAEDWTLANHADFSADEDLELGGRGEAVLGVLGEEVVNVGQWVDVEQVQALLGDVDEVWAQLSWWIF